MSAGRKYRRQARRWVVRQPGVEPSAETRAWVARMIAAHDDDTVGMAEFYEIAMQFSVYASQLPEAERVEAACQVSDHATRSLTGRRLRTVAFRRAS